jgi:hypothetical protein
MLASGRRTSRDTTGSINLNFAVRDQYLPILGFILGFEFRDKWYYSSESFRLSSEDVIVCDVEQNTGTEAESENDSRPSAGKYEIHMSGKNAQHTSGICAKKVVRSFPAAYDMVRKASGLLKSGTPDLSENHDKHFSEHGFDILKH